jgi:single-strand DNA-binding protein
MANYNKVILLGNMTRDPQLKYLPSNLAVCEFGLAINHRWRDKDGNQKEEVCFVDVSAFGRQGETINQYMTKGKPILVEGRLRFDSWTGQDGQKRSKLSVVAETFQFVGARGDQPGAPSGGAPASGAPYARSAPPPDDRPRGGPSAPAPEAPDDIAPPAGDEIPF